MTETNNLICLERDKQLEISVRTSERRVWGVGCKVVRFRV